VERMKEKEWNSVPVCGCVLWEKFFVYTLNVFVSVLLMSCVWF